MLLTCTCTVRAQRGAVRSTRCSDISLITAEEMHDLSLVVAQLRCYEHRASVTAAIHAIMPRHISMPFAARRAGSALTAAQRVCPVSMCVHVYMYVSVV